MKISTITNDGCHITDYNDFFEWWYFDFDSETGHSIYLEWHSPVLNLRSKLCILVIRIFAPENSSTLVEDRLPKISMIKTYRYPRSVVTSENALCDIRFPGGRIHEKNGNYFINIHEKDVSISLRLKKSLPRLFYSEELLYESPNGREHFFWCVPLPRGHATGEVALGDLRLRIDGLSYHDHNWGNLNMAKYLTGWIWARVFFKDFTLIFGELSPRHSSKEYTAHLFDEIGNRISTKLPTVSYARTRDEQFGVEIPTTLSISFGKPLRYSVEIVSEINLTKQEFPLSSFDNHRINTCIASMYYFLGLNRAPESLRKIMGRGAYLQFEVKARLFVDDMITDTGGGRMEVFFFGV
jgi:hypothetical protein